MKILMFSFLPIVIFATFPVDAQKREDTDWSKLFPEFPGCERVVEPLARTGEIFEQTARYERQGRRDNQFYFPCGSITLRFEPSARKKANLNYAKSPGLPPLLKRKVKAFDAYLSSPLCGLDEWMGATSIFFEENMVLTVSAYRGSHAILDFAETADYNFLKKSIGDFIKK